MPTIQQIESGLGQATELFAAELALPGDSTPEWTPFEWTMARAAAVLHGVAPLLSKRLRWSGPPVWQQFVESQFTHTRARQRRMQRLLGRIDAACRAAGIGCMPLKGSALHAMNLYRAGERPMADIDLLVHPRDASAVASLLQALEFTPTHSIWKHQVFESQQHLLRTAANGARVPAFGEHREAPIKLELHTRVTEQLPIAHRDITAWMLPADLRAGLNPYPSSVALLLHLLLHAAGNMMGHALRLIHLHDIALLASGLEQTDWQRMQDARLDDQPLYWALPPLSLAQRYFAGCVPNEVLQTLSIRCPSGLQRNARRQSLTDVSYARLSIPLMPELVWSTSMPERMRCIGRRIHPGAEVRAVHALVRADAWSSQLSPRRWARILRRVLLDAPRESSMYVVRAALAEPAPGTAHAPKGLQRNQRKADAAATL